VEGQDDIDALLKRLEGMPAGGEDDEDEDDEVGREGKRRPLDHLAHFLSPPRTRTAFRR